MLTEDELRKHQAHFEQTCRQNAEQQKRFREFEKLRRQFVATFPLKRVERLTLDEYVEGKRNKESFCYWVEVKTASLGHIWGGTANKFGVYYDKELHTYKTTRGFSNPQKAMEFIRCEIARLLKFGEHGDLDGIHDVKISPMFKGKILFLYYPDKYLNVFAEEHVDYFLRRARLYADGSDQDLIGKRNLLLAFKNGDEVMKTWTMYEFGYFLYREFGHPADPAKTPKLLQEYVDDFPPVEKQIAQFIESAPQNVPTLPSAKLSHKGKPVDFESQNKKNKRIGDQGEDLVFLQEKQRLEQHNRSDLAKKVEGTYKENPGAGYDIASFELDGTPKYIEVKSTTASLPQSGETIRFHLSATELHQAQNLANYYLYLVFDIKSLQPKIWTIPNPSTLVNAKLVLQPSSYHAFLCR